MSGLIGCNEEAGWAGVGSGCDVCIYYLRYTLSTASRKDGLLYFGLKGGGDGGGDG